MTTTTRPAVDVGRGHTRSTTTDDRAHWRPLLLGGPLMVALYLLATALAGEAPANGTAQAELVTYWAADAAVAAAFLATGAGFAGAAFAVGLHGLLRDNGLSGPAVTMVALGGAVLAAGLAAEGSTAMALHDAATESSPASVEALHALFGTSFLSITIGLGLLLAGAGFALRGSGLVAPPVAWAAIVLGCMAPFFFAGFATFFLGSIWIALAGLKCARS